MIYIDITLTTFQVNPSQDYPVAGCSTDPVTAVGRAVAPPVGSAAEPATVMVCLILVD